MLCWVLVPGKGDADGSEMSADSPSRKLDQFVLHVPRYTEWSGTKDAKPVEGGC